MEMTVKKLRIDSKMAKLTGNFEWERADKELQGLIVEVINKW